MVSFKWMNPQNPREVYLIPVKDISLNHAFVGNHPTCQGVQNYLESSGYRLYRAVMASRRRRTRGKGKVIQHDSAFICEQPPLDAWSGHQNVARAGVDVDMFWLDPRTNKCYPLFTTFQDLVDYMQREGANAYPIRVMIECDGEIVAMEGRHRMLAATVLEMKLIPCWVQVRQDSHEPEISEKVRRVEQRRLVPSD